MAESTEFLVAFGMSALLCGVFARFAPAWGLLDHPGGHREHEHETPLVGGLAMFIAFLCVSLLFLEISGFRGLLAGGALLVIVGVIDDRHELPTSVRFIAQILAAMAIIYFDRVELRDLGNLFSGDLLVLGRWSVFMTIFAVVGVINAINMSDGIDGLAGSLICVTLGYLLIISPAGAYAGINLALLGAVVGFLCWNLRVGRPRAAIFMGDAGSMFLGLCVAWLLISGSQGEERLFSPVTALWLLALPLWDTVAALVVRPLLGASPFSADRFHYHHVLLSLGLTVNRTLFVSLVCALSVGFAGTMAWFYQLPEWMMFYLFLLFFIGYCATMIMRRREIGLPPGTDE